MIELEFVSEGVIVGGVEAISPGAGVLLDGFTVDLLGLQPVKNVPASIRETKVRTRILNVRLFMIEPPFKLALNGMSKSIRDIDTFKSTSCLRYLYRIKDLGHH